MKGYLWVVCVYFPVPLTIQIPLLQVCSASVSWLSYSPDCPGEFFTTWAPSTGESQWPTLGVSTPRSAVDTTSSLNLSSVVYTRGNAFYGLWYFSWQCLDFLLIFFLLTVAVYEAADVFWDLWTDNPESISEMISGLPSSQLFFFLLRPPWETLLCSISNSLAFHCPEKLRVTCKPKYSNFWIWMKLLKPGPALVPEDSHYYFFQWNASFLISQLPIHDWMDSEISC